MASKGTNKWTEYGSFQSVADLSSSKYRVCKVPTAVAVATATGQDVIGILGADVDDYTSLATGQYGRPEVIVHGRATAVGGGVIAAGVWCKGTTAGKLVAASAGEIAICQTLEASAADGDEIAVYVHPMHVPA